MNQGSWVLPPLQFLLCFSASADVGFAVWDRLLEKELLPHVSYTAHLMGSLAGLTMGLLVLKNFDQQLYRQYTWWIAFTVYAGCVSFAVCWNLIYYWPTAECFFVNCYFYQFYIYKTINLLIIRCCLWLSSIVTVPLLLVSLVTSHSRRLSLCNIFIFWTTLPVPTKLSTRHLFGKDNWRVIPFSKGRYMKLRNSENRLTTF